MHGVPPELVFGSVLYLLYIADL